jgi:hypothetical protein
MTDFIKIDNTCSNIYLIDEGLCLGNTLDLINYNINSLQYAISSIKQYESVWYNLYTTFTSYSAKWLQTATNIQAFSATWIDMSTTVSNLSSDWNKEYTLYYPYIIDINTWYSTDQTPTIKNWLTNAFTTLPKSNSLIVSVMVYLKQNQLFSFSFNRSYTEACIPNVGGYTISCNGGSKPYQGCNHHGGNAGVGPCTNLYDVCSRSTPSVSGKISCQGSGGKTLNIGITRSAIDTNIAQTVKLRFNNINNIWTSI